MRIVTYNVFGFRGYPSGEGAKLLGWPPGEKGIEHFSTVFAELEADILAIQEGAEAAFIQAIACRLGYNLATIPSPGRWPGHILTRYPILESRVFSHYGPQALDLPLSRHLGAALLEIEDGIRLWVMSIHLYPGVENGHRRLAEKDIVLARVDELLNHTPNLVLLGDFNSEVQEPLHQELVAKGFMNAMASSKTGLQYTMDTVGEPQCTIDHIYLSPSLKPRFVDAHVVRKPGFRSDGPQVPGLMVHSDHLPVAVDLS